MADTPLRLLVNKDVYMSTLSQLDAQLSRLRAHRDNLQRQIERLESGNTFSGTSVQPAIRKAKEALEKVKDAISRVQGYRVAINQNLEGLQSSESTLESDMNGMSIPDMFG